MTTRTATLLCLFVPAWAGAQSRPALQVTQGDFAIKDFRFRTGEVLPELRLHYATLGTPVRDASGRVVNAVLLLHGTSGSGQAYLQEPFAKTMYGPGQPLDVSRWYVILPDSVGHGRSSKPSDGLHARFPRYDYYDMVEAQYRLVSGGLGVAHLRLVAGISMGGMHTWLWGEEHPDFMDALLPLVSQPVEIAGRNRMWRRTAADAIRNDPAWNGGEYTKRPEGLVAAARIFVIVVSGDLDLQRQASTRAEADRLLDQAARRWSEGDANDLLYQLDSSRTYDPQPNLERIRARLVAVNVADDFINPPDLGIMEREMKRVRNGRFVMLESTGRGHITVFDPDLWKGNLVELLGTSATEVPLALVLGPDEVLALRLDARGTQNYECRARQDAPGRAEWVFVAPEADLFDGGGRRVGRHYAGPTWESSDGSRVVGKVKARADALAPDAIPWLLLAATETTRQGAFAGIRSVQRLDTQGGMPPAGDCPRVGEVLKVPYRAVYAFSRSK